MIRIVVFMLLSVGCQQKSADATLPPSGMAGTSAPAVAPKGIPESKHFAGVVKEVIAEQGISYVHLQIDGGDQTKWVALVDTKAKVGQHLSIDGEIEMKDFFSKSLNRRFAKITFGKVSRR